MKFQTSVVYFIFFIPLSSDGDCYPIYRRAPAPRGYVIPCHIIFLVDLLRNNPQPVESGRHNSTDSSSTQTCSLHSTHMGVVVDQLGLKAPDSPFLGLQRHSSQSVTSSLTSSSRLSLPNSLNSVDVCGGRR